MARLKWALLAQVASLDKETNALTLVHVVEELTVPAAAPDPEPDKVTAVGPGFFVVINWRRDDDSKPETTRGRMRMVGPTRRKELASTEFEIDLTGKSLRARSLVKVPFFPYVGPGRYAFEIDVAAKGAKPWRKVGDVAVDVRKAATAV